MILTIIFLVLIGMAAAIYLFMKQPEFGTAPSGKSLERIKNSPNYKEGQFQNLSNTPSLTGGVSYFTVLKEFFFGKSKRSTPSEILPSKKTDLFGIDLSKDILVWFGHSSYYIQIDGKKILVDPVFSGSASPLKFTTRSFNGSDVYTAGEIPAIDYLFITHDHWDHLDYETIIKLKGKIKKVITGLGVGDHFKRWGFNMDIVVEKDWNEEVILDNGFIVHTAPARHFSGRGFKRNRSIWLSFILKTPTLNIYLGGDSGYDSHFESIGKLHGPFDLAILEDGQYNKYWKYIHMMPEEVVQAAIDLRAKKLLPVHWSKFSLSLHDWDEPIKRVLLESKKKNVKVIHPLIGETVDLKNNTGFPNWWESIN